MNNNELKINVEFKYMWYNKVNNIQVDKYKYI